MRACAGIICIILAVGVVGCGPAVPPKAKLYPVKGRVTLNGKSLTGCTLMLVSMTPTKNSDDSYVGVLNDEGKFELTNPNGKPGAAVGKYKVTFSMGYKAGGVRDPKETFDAVMKGTAKMGAKELPFPKEFESALTSKKEVTISAENQTQELLIAI